MTIRIIRLGSPRSENEGLRIGAVRRPPRGVKKEEYATKDIYDVWFPNLSPTEDLLKEMERWPLDEKKANQWAEGAHFQFGITSILCEGAGALYTKKENTDSGAVLVKTIGEYYTDLKE